MADTYQITADDVITFTEGDCWALARQISEQTGWQAYAIGAFAAVDQVALEDFIWVHVVVATPTGEYVDVQGVTDHANLVNRYVDVIREVHGFTPGTLKFLPISSAAEWDSTIHGQVRVYPGSATAPVAAALIDEYENYIFAQQCNEGRFGSTIAAQVGDLLLAG